MSDPRKPIGTPRPTALVPRAPRVPAPATQRAPNPPPAPLPSATIIYGTGGALVCVAAFSLLFHGRWFPALITLAVGCCLLGFAWHLLNGTRR